MLLGLYRHYKGELYLVKCVLRHTETGEHLVAYQSMYGDFGHHGRPLDMFNSKVKYGGKTVDRFTYVGNPAETAPKDRAGEPKEPPPMYYP